MLRFQTRVIPYREIIDRSEISQYKSDIEKMFNRSLNRFPWQIDEARDTQDFQTPPNRGALLAGVIILCLFTWYWIIN